MYFLQLGEDFIRSKTGSLDQMLCYRTASEHAVQTKGCIYTESIQANIKLKVKL